MGSLRLGLILYIVIPLGVLMGVGGYLTFSALERHVEERMQKDLELVARAIRLPISHALERDRSGSVLRALESAFRIGRVYSAYVYDADGERIAVAGAIDPAPRQRVLSRLAAGGERHGEYGEVAGQDVYSYFVPLTDSGGRINGLLQLTRQQSEFQEYIARMRLWFIGALGFSILVTAVLVLYGHHRALGISFRRLVSSMHRVKQGDIRHRSIVEGPREIMALAGSFNSMLDGIEEAQREIESRRQEEQRLQQRLRQTEKLAAIGQLAAGVAHELGTPLSVIDGKAQRALRRQDMCEHGREALQQVRHEVQRMEHIVRQLLDFSTNSMHCRNTSAARLAQSAASALADRQKRSAVRLQLRGESTAPLFRADPIRLEQVLVNLLENAMEAAPGGEVHLAWEVCSHRLCFTVEDSGPGVPESISHRIFEPFFTTRPVGQGTGLGLAVVHGIIEEHGGTIEVGRSALGGALFQVVLPIGQGGAAHG